MNEDMVTKLLLERFDSVDGTLEKLQGKVDKLSDDVVRLKVVVPFIGAGVGSGATLALGTIAKMLHIL